MRLTVNILNFVKLLCEFAREYCLKRMKHIPDNGLYLLEIIGILLFRNQKIKKYKRLHLTNS